MVQMFCTPVYLWKFIFHMPHVFHMYHMFSICHICCFIQSYCDVVYQFVFGKKSIERDFLKLINFPGRLIIYSLTVQICWIGAFYDVKLLGSCNFETIILKYTWVYMKALVVYILGSLDKHWSCYQSSL